MLQTVIRCVLSCVVGRYWPVGSLW